MSTDLILTVIASAMGFNVALWLAIGLARFCDERLFTRGRVRPPLAARVRIEDVAVVIAAHNEESALPMCLRALLRIVPAGQIHIASDGSTDRTVAVARARGCQVLDIQPNVGKARALDRAIKGFDLPRRYRAVLIQDADSEIDLGFFRHALPLFDDPAVVAVAGHVVSRWPAFAAPSFRLLYAAYRTRLYRLLQAVFQYGQTWRRTGVSYIVPGFASMYRTSILPAIDLTAPGIVIEDFNMTFEVQKKKLGRIAYSPRARCSSEDPFRLRDYRKQVQRWYLGFWQTVRRHGVWPGKFWLALGPLVVELVIVSLFLVTLPVLALAHLVFGVDAFAVSLGSIGLHRTSPLELLAAFAAADYALTIVVAAIERRAVLLLYGLAFPALRILDAALFLAAAIESLVVRSDGRWSSPLRRADEARLVAPQ